MIKLKVAEYCHNCPDFKADVDVDDFGYKVGDEYCLHTTTTVTCEHAKRCQSIFEYFKKTYDIASKPVRIKETE